MSSLEQDINQPIFKSPRNKALINLIYTSNWLNERIKIIFDKEDITSQQFNILRILRGAGNPLSTMQIRQRMLDKMSDTSRIVDRLVLKGYVTKQTCPGDKRLVDVTINAKGKKLLQKLDALEYQINDHLSALSEEEATRLNGLLDKIRG